MDEAAIEAKGTAPLKPYMDSIDGMKNKSDVPAVLGGLHRAGVNVFFGFGAEPDFKDSKVDIATAGQGGLSLPDKDYYFKDDAKSVELRQKLEQHIAKMFELYGEPAGQGRGRRQDRHEGGNRSGQRLAQPHRAARSHQALPQDERGRSAEDDARLLVEPVHHQHSIRQPSTA